MTERRAPALEGGAGARSSWARFTLSATLALVAGCMQESTVSELYDWPAGYGPQELVGAEVAAALGEWRGRGMPDATECPGASVGVVPDEWFEVVSGLPSCYSEARPEQCGFAHTKFVGGYPVVFLPESLSDGVIPGHDYSDEVRHEMFHVWSWCTSGSPDERHEGRVWE